MQRRRAFVVCGIDFGPVGQQQFRHFLMAPKRRGVQRCLTVVVPGIDFGSMAQQQFRHILTAIVAAAATASLRPCFSH